MDEIGEAIESALGLYVPNGGSVMNPVLTIDPEFEAKCPPLTEDELSQLEENILEEGLVLMPLIVWNDTIVDGHNRYRIAQTHPASGSAPMKRTSIVNTKLFPGFARTSSDGEILRPSRRNI